MRVIVVDKNDQQIGVKDIEDLELDDIYRVSSLWVTNSKGQVLIAQRKFNKKHDPGKWAAAAAGTVEEGEDYETNTYHEAEEEIGLTGYKFKVGPKILNDSHYKFFVQWFTVEVDWPLEKFTIQEDEVEVITWIDKVELKTELTTDPGKYVAGFNKVISLFLS